MVNISRNKRQDKRFETIETSIDAPLWLLQKDDSRFLYISFFLSVTVHIILFAIMAATHIFHPLTGSTQEFDLVWFSPARMTVPSELTTNNSSDLIKIPDKIARNIPAAKPSPAVTPQVKTAPEPPLPAKTISPPPPPTSMTAPATEEIQTADATPIEEPAEMTISRFSGKVVEVVEKKAENPTFNVISSVKMKSKNARTVVQSIRESDVKPKIPPKNRPKTNQSEDNVAATQSKKELPGKQIEKVAMATASPNQSKVSQSTIQENAIQRKVSSAAIAPAGNKSVTLPAVNRSINSFAAALNTLSAAGNKQTAQAQTTQRQVNGSTGLAQHSSLKSPAEPKTPVQPPTVEKTTPPKEKLAPQPVAAPQFVLHPPVAGDLKLIITGDIDPKVEVFFKAFPRSRRSKPFTRWEAEKRRTIIPKLVRTGEKVHEAVVEVTEEGIYSIMIRINNGKPGTAGLTLKIRESSPGAKSKNLGSQRIDDLVEVAKVLMPEGVLWNDESYFTGDMEDADSITKFNSGTGLMWREYK